MTIAIGIKTAVMKEREGVPAIERLSLNRVKGLLEKMTFWPRCK